MGVMDNACGGGAPQAQTTKGEGFEIHLQRALSKDIVAMVSIVK